MTQYIDKAAVVVEIEKRLDELWDLLPNASDVIKDNYTKEEANITGKYTALESFENFINTIEVKEVDLNKEINQQIEKYFDECEKMNFYPYIPKFWSTYSILNQFAKHFFELGLKMNQKGE